MIASKRRTLYFQLPTRPQSDGQDLSLVHLASKGADSIDFVVTALIVLMLLTVAIIAFSKLDKAITLINMIAQGAFHRAETGIMVHDVGARSLGVVDGN